MKQAWLIINGYMVSPKFGEIYNWLVEAAAKKDIELKVLTNDRVASILSINSGTADWRVRPEFIIFWDKDVNLARALEKEGFRVYNSARSIEICDDKAKTFLELKHTDIPMPKTYAAPLCFDSKYPDFSFLMQVSKYINFPMIIKECKGSFGQQVYLAKDLERAKEIIGKIKPGEFIMQECINESLGKSARLQVVGTEIVCAMKLTNGDNFVSNATLGGSMEQYTPSAKEKAMALEATKVLGLDFAGVDIIWNEDGEPLLCEVNSNAHFKNIFDCTGVNVADYILEHIINDIKNTNE